MSGGELKWLEEEVKRVEEDKERQTEITSNKDKSWIYIPKNHIRYDEEKEGLKISVGLSHEERIVSNTYS